MASALAVTDLRQECDTVKFQLVTVALELAITYCQIAADTTNPTRCRKSVARAERAYTTAVSYLDDHLISAQNFEIKVKLDRFLSLRARCDGNHREPTSRHRPCITRQQEPPKENLFDQSRLDQQDHAGHECVSRVEMQRRRTKQPRGQPNRCREKQKRSVHKRTREPRPRVGRRRQRATQIVPPSNGERAQCVPDVTARVFG